MIYKFNYRDKDFVKIDIFLLFEIINYLISFILNDFFYKIIFKFINSFIF